MKTFLGNFFLDSTIAPLGGHFPWSHGNGQLTSENWPCSSVLFIAVRRIVQLTNVDHLTK